MWKFFEERNGRVLPNANLGSRLVCDAFVWVVQQSPPGRMTVLGAISETKSLLGKPRETILRATRFTRNDAAGAAAHAATQVALIYETFQPVDTLWDAISAAQSEKITDINAAVAPVSAAVNEAREAGNGAAAFAAEAACSAVFARIASDDGAALYHAGYAVAYAIQAADKVGSDQKVTTDIEKWLLDRAVNLQKVKV